MINLLFSFTRQPVLIFPMLYPNATFLGVRTQGAVTPKCELGRDFVQCTYPKFHDPMFIRSEVIMLTKNTPTNKQTDATENIQRSSLCYDVG